jgi:hypothetical protein
MKYQIRQHSSRRQRCARCSLPNGALAFDEWQADFFWKMIEKGRSGTYNRNGARRGARVGQRRNGVRPESIQS